MQTATLKVEGMSCNHCKKTVSDALAALEGVRKVDVDLATGEVRVEFDPAKTPEGALRRAVEEVGYDVKA